MSDEEFDAALVERFKAYEARVRLPDEFKSRFIGALCRRRALRRFWMFGLVCVMSVACAAIVNFGRNDAANVNANHSLVANSAHTNDTAEVSYWMLLGYLRECFSRFRSSRKKEEE